MTFCFKPQRSLNSDSMLSKASSIRIGLNIPSAKTLTRFSSSPALPGYGDVKAPRLSAMACYGGVNVSYLFVSSSKRAMLVTIAEKIVPKFGFLNMTRGPVMVRYSRP